MQKGDKCVPASPQSGQLKDQTHCDPGKLSTVQLDSRQRHSEFMYVGKSQVLRAIQILDKRLSRITHLLIGNQGQLAKLNY